MQASKIYKESATLLDFKSNDSIGGLFKYTKRCHLMYSLILLLDSLSNDDLLATIDEYITMLPMFANSIEHNLVIKLNDAYRKKDTHAIQQIIDSNKLNFSESIIKVIRDLKK